MSWHYLQGQEAASWEGSSLDGAPSALLRLIPIADECSSQDSGTGSSRHSQSGTTSAPSTAGHGAGTPISSPEDFRVRTSLPLPEMDADSTESEAGSGRSSRALSAKCVLSMSSLRTRQLCAFEDSTACSPTLPVWGSMRGGVVSERKRPAALAKGAAFGSWPRPTASMSTHGWGQTRQRQGNRYGKAVRENVAREKEAHGWRPRINLLEWIMGWPIGWSALEPLEMARFRQWLLLHGRCSHQTEAISEQG